MCKYKFVIAVTITLAVCTSNLNALVNSPKIIVKDGHLIFESGLDRNITFLLKGKSRLNVNNEFDIVDMLMQSNKGRLTSSLSSQSEWSEEEDAILKQIMADVTSLNTRVFGPNGLEFRYHMLQNRTRNASQYLRRYKIRMLRVENGVQSLYDILEKDNCKSNPCQNGGSCLNIFDNYVCKCSKNFEGISCEKDVNECALYAGTDLGCQNGAQCINQFGAFSCICQPGWFGIHCTQRKGDCLQSSVWEMCGHGTCVSSNDTFGYKCICDQGWKTNGLTPACTVDVDECAESHTACVTKCINLPGSFTCAPCPAGLTGNGINCRDIDECSTQNGGCSLSPKVKCLNSYGSYHCGECPLGWSGNGRTCERTSTTDVIAENTNGAVIRCATSSICHPQAKCHEISNTIVCSCPEGMVGSGIGINGCILGTAKNCLSQPCLNGGTCVDSGDGYNCVCPLGFLQPTCTPAPSLCSPNPCHNGGRCTVIHTTSVFKNICECRPGFRGEKCEKRANDCGGVLKGESGRLSYPIGMQKRYEHNSQCAWIIRTNETLVLNVTFNSFELEDATECRFDWLQINDGHSAGSQIIGRFCGTHKPLGGNIISSTHQLYLWFRSDNSTSKEGFDLEWNSIPPQCGGLVNVSMHGTISSPGSPGSYPKNRDCRWTLRAPNDKRLKLTFFNLNIEKHDTCNFDYVEITDAISGDTLEKYCNSTNPQPVLLPTNEAIVHFHSDNIGTDTGFQIFYSTEERVHNCGGVYTAKEGTIQSPHILDETISCQYEIRMTKSESITIRFQVFKMAAQDCIEIYDVKGDSNENVLQAKYCGEYEIIPPLIHSQFNTIILKFYGKPGAEFKLNYIADCSYNFEAPEGVIKSPNYPQLSKKDRYCTYNILTEPNTVITIHIDDFDLKDSSIDETDCVYTHLTINDVMNKNTMGPYCGEEAPLADIVFKTNMLALKLKTGLTTTGRGLQLSYKAIPMGEADCGGVYTKPGYTIKLPTDEEDLYRHDMTCYWIIMAPKDKFIVIDWISFELEESNDCSYDYIELYDNLANEGSQALERYCDAHRPESFLTHSRILTVKFVSDTSDTAKGFEFNYKFVDASNQCGGKIYSSNGKIHTPNWPLNYSSNLDCTWIINTPPTTQLELQIEIFDVEMSKNCSSDWLEIRNGGSNHSTLLGRFCGNMTNIPHTIPSFTNQMYLSFHSNSFVNKRGLQIHWSVFSNGCGGNLVGEQGVITSPYYPEAYPNSAECDWRIHVNPGSAIHITVLDLALESYSNCRYDTLSIFEGTTDNKMHLSSICQMNEDKKPLEYIINNNQALIQLKTDETNRERGFLLSYRANCSVTLNKNYGVIESPNYGVPFNEYSDDVNCTWILKAPKGNRIQAEFTYYDSIDKTFVLDIRDGNNKTYNIQNQGQTINSSSDVLIIQQRTNKLNFQLEYAMIGCIDVFRANEGKFASPNYPKPYPNNIECFWEISTQPGQGIEISIESLDLEDSVNCTEDALIISPHYQSNNVKERHCGQHEKLLISTSSHKLYVRFISNSRGNGKGFQIDYKTKTSSCGGNLQSKNGVITSPNYPNNYPDNSDCEWTITVSTHHAIILTMEELDLEDFYDCGMDYVEAYEEGSDSEAEEPLQLFKQCGSMNSESNTIWRSTSNTVTIRFHSDDSVPAKGFKLSYIEDCGERVTIEETTYAMIQYKKHALVNKSCEWQFISKDPSKHIALTFRHLLINPALANLYPNETDCIYQGGIIYDGESDTSPVRARFCKTHPPDLYSNGHAFTLKVPMNLISEIYAFAYQLDNFCGNVYESITGKFASPYYPSSYPVNIECTYYIDVSHGNSIGLAFEFMDLEDSDECNNDYVEIREGEDSLGKLLGVYCGNKIPAVLKGSEVLTINFNSNNDIVGQGFIATYFYVKHNELNGTKGIVESPAYPAKFHSDELYSWRITVDKHYVVLLTIKHIVDLDIPFIKFYDGYSDIGAPIDYTNTHVVRSNTNILYFTATRGPFQFEWEQLSKDVVRSNQTAEEMSEICGWEILRLNSSLIFNSPGYPKGYNNNLHCSWTIMSNNPAMHAEISFLKVDLEEFDECFADYIKISKSTDLQNWQELEKICKKPSDKIMKYQGNPFLKLEFVTDAGINKTGFSSLITTACGSELTDRRGFVNITELKGSRASSYTQECIWTIKVRQGRRIRLKFPDFWLHNRNTDGNCNTFILVRNGMAEDSPFLGKGKYCDNDINDVLESSSNRAYIKFFRSNHIRYRASFHYEEISPDCSKEIILTEGYKWDQLQTIATPNYPNIPNPHSECIWKIIAPLHKTITLDFFGDYDLIPVNSDSKLCELEYVQVNDGATEIAPVIGKYCGNTKPNSIRSTSNILRVLYFTDVSEPHKGFQANVSISRCGGSYYDSEGTITAPLLQLKPNEKEVECIYTLEMPLGSTINISVDKINLPEPHIGYNGDCKFETHLELQEIDAFSTDTENITDTLLLCGTETNRYIVETNKLKIVLRILNGTYNADSFQIFYSAIGDRCGETIVGSHGILQTPNYPKGTGEPIHCNWNIRAPKGLRIKIEFLDFDIGTEHSTGRVYRRLTFANDPKMSSIIERVTDTLPAVIYSTDNTITIDALMLSFYRNRGFKLKYSADEYSTLCRNFLWFYDDDVMESPQTLKFKRDDSNKSVYCSYDLKPNFNHTLSVQIIKDEKYNMTQPWYTFGCQFSSPVQLFAGDERILPMFMCRNETQPSIRLPYVSKLVLTGHKRNALRDLELQLTSYKCGGIWPMSYYENFVITQPDMKNHSGHLECAWAIWGYYGDNTNEPPTFADILDEIQLDISLSVNFKGKCEEEYLMVYNGPNQNSPHLGRYCEESTITNFVASRGVFVEFVTQNYNPLSVFNLSIHEGSGCGGVLKYPYREIMFNYQYKNNVECVWDLATDPGFHLAAIFSNRFFIEWSQNCTKDYLKIQQKSSKSEWEDIVTLCGRSPPAMVNTTTTEMRIIFRSDDSVTGSGFTLNFERNCGGILYATDIMQQITSPNYPNDYPPNLFCNYTIVPSPTISKTEDDSLFIRFKDFMLEDSPLNKCMFDNVTINTLNRHDQLEANTLCGRKTNYEMRSKKSISIILTTDGSYSRRGFLMEYGHNKCGAVVSNSTIIESPKDSTTQMYPHSSVCTWQLQAPENHKIMIKFEYIDFESQGMCTYDAVEVYKGLNTVEDQRLIKLCGNLTGQKEIVNIAQNTGLIRSFTDDYDASRGFKALIKFAPNCDQHIHLTSSNSSYEFNHFSGQYANNLDCSWLFTTTADRQLKLKFMSFHVESSSNCLNDYLDIHDGSGLFTDQIGKFCGHELPSPLMASKSALLLRFVTDSMETSSGFVANIISVANICGQQSFDLTKEKTITLSAPGDGSGKYPNNINCIWRIKAENKIHLHFEKLDINGPDENGLCSENFIKIINSDDAEAVEKGYGSKLLFNGHTSSYSGDSSYAAEHIYCGSRVPDDYFSSSKGVFVKFKSSNATGKNSFTLKASLAEGCFRNFTGTQGRIKLDESNDHCDIYIKAPINYTLSLYYNELIFSEYDCDSEYLEVFDARNGTSLQKLCEFVDTGKSLFSNSNELRLQIELSGYYTQIDITYLASNNGPGCGGTFYNTQGIFTNPFYPEHVRNNSDCRWNIRVPSNLKVFLKFPVFNLGAKSTCRTDYLQIIEYENNDTNEEKIMRQFCGEDEPQYYESSKSSVIVRFHKSFNYDGTGWVITFKGVYPGDTNNY